jgi:hypothetical protein
LIRSPGWVNQWGEVKTKKAKKESQQKAKSEAAAVANQQQHQQSTLINSVQIGQIAHIKVLIEYLVDEVFIVEMLTSLG